jgi:hypothetical protein
MNLAAQLSAANGIAQPAALPTHWALLFGHAAPHPLPEPVRTPAPREKPYRQVTPIGMQDDFLAALESGPGTTTALAHFVGTTPSAARRCLQRMELRELVSVREAFVNGRNTLEWSAK